MAIGIVVIDAALLGGNATCMPCNDVSLLWQILRISTMKVNESYDKQQKIYRKIIHNFIVQVQKQLRELPKEKKAKKKKLDMCRKDFTKFALLMMTV